MEEDKQFNKGFNQGYILNKYSKDVAETVSKSFQGSNEYIEGFNEGGKEATQEIQLTRFNELDKLRNKETDMDLGLEL